MRRVRVAWQNGADTTYKCDSMTLPATGQNVLCLRGVRSQDPGYNRIVAETKIIPLDRVAAVDDNEW